MKTNRTKNTTRNIVCGVLNKAVTLIFPFLTRTIIIKTLGTDYLGLSSLYSSILQVLNLAELGFGSAVVFSMYKPIAEGDRNTICALLKLYRRVYRVIGIGILVFGLALTPFLEHLIKGSHPEAINIFWLYIIELLNTSLTYLFFGYRRALLDAHQRRDVISNVDSIARILMYLLQILVLVLYKNYYVYTALAIVSTMSSNLASTIITQKRYPNYVCKGELDKETTQDIRRRIAGIMLGKVCGTTRNSFDSIFISSFIGLNAVAIYGNYYYILSGVQGVLVVLTVAMKASVGNSIATESVDKNHTDMINFNFIYMLLAGWCSITMLCLYQHFMHLWVGDKLTFSMGFVILMCVYFYALAIGDIRNVFVEATGLWWEQRYRAIAESVANLLLNFALVQVWGVLGVVLATLVSLLIFNIIYGSQIIYKYYFKRSAKPYYLKHLLYTGVTIIAGGATYLVCLLLPNSGYGAFCLKLLVCCLVPNFIYFIAYFRSTEFGETKKLVYQILFARVQQLKS